MPRGRARGQVTGGAGGLRPMRRRGSSSVGDGPDPKEGDGVPAFPPIHPPCRRHEPPRNADLLGSRIRNYGRRFERRVALRIGVIYQTPPEKPGWIPSILREAVEELGDPVRFDRAPFQAYGDFAITFETVYYVLGPDYNLYMGCQQAINLTIHRRFQDEGIEFAYPTQTLFLVKPGGEE